MNATTNSTMSSSNYTFHSHEWWLQFGGSHEWSDAIGIFIMPPITVIGTFLNLAGFLVLQFNDKFAQAKIYTYLKFNFLNEFICSATGILYPFTVVRRYLKLSNSYFSLWYMNSIGLPIANLCYFFNTMVDVLITFEKLSIFVKRLENINTVLGLN
jgi:hypothetical protein